MALPHRVATPCRVALAMAFVWFLVSSRLAAGETDPPEAASVFPKTVTLTRVLDLSPDWIVVFKDAEYQHYSLSLEEANIRFHGKVFLDNREVTGGIIGETLHCALGEFAWMGDLDNPETEGRHTGWFPLRNTLEAEGFQADLSMDLGIVVDRAPDAVETLDNGDVWHYWRYPDDPDAGYGALRVGGKWVVGASPGQRVRLGGRDFTWKEAYAPDRNDVISGWRMEESVVPEPRTEDGDDGR